jgi:hypothetical protein
MLLLALIVVVFGGLIAWCWCDAPNARPPTPQRRQKDLWR